MFLAASCIPIFNPDTHFLHIRQLLGKYLAKIDMYAKILALGLNKLIVKFSKPINQIGVILLIGLFNPFVNYQSKASLLQKPKFSKFISDNCNKYFSYPH
jgi:hypothetical protein